MTGRHVWILAANPLRAPSCAWPIGLRASPTAQCDDILVTLVEGCDTKIDEVAGRLGLGDLSAEELWFAVTDAAGK